MSSSRSYFHPRAANLTTASPEPENPVNLYERIAEVARNHHRSMNSEIIARLEQSLIQEGALGDELSMRLDSPELSLHERELLQRFRQLSHRQQNALVALIAHDVEMAADAS